MRQTITQDIFLNNGDLDKLRSQGLTLRTPDGHTFRIFWESAGNITAQVKNQNNYNRPKKHFTKVQQILDYLEENGLSKPKDIYKDLNLKDNLIRNYLMRLLKRGKVKRFDHKYQLIKVGTIEK